MEALARQDSGTERLDDTVHAMEGVAASVKISASRADVHGSSVSMVQIESRLGRQRQAIALHSLH